MRKNKHSANVEGDMSGLAAQSESTPFRNEYSCSTLEESRWMRVRASVSPKPNGRAVN